MVAVCLGLARKKHVARFRKWSWFGYKYTYYCKIHQRWMLNPSTPPSSIRGLFLLFILNHRISSFAPVIMTIATRGHRLTININMFRNNLLAQATYMAVCLARTSWMCLQTSASAVIFNLIISLHVIITWHTKTTLLDHSFLKNIFVCALWAESENFITAVSSVPTTTH